MGLSTLAGNASSARLERIGGALDVRYELLQTATPDASAAAPAHGPLNLVRLVYPNDVEPTKGAILFLHGYKTDWPTFMDVAEEADTPTPIALAAAGYDVYMASRRGGTPH